jgi:hypothetical protein
MNHDYTMIFAKNCSACGNKNFDAMKSEEMGFLKPNLSTEFIEMGVNGTE